MSSPSSSYSSPCRRSPRPSCSPVPGACGGPHRPNLSRRWSLDNLSSQREGYVRDLRRQHQRDKVEVYPFMLTERNSLRQTRDVIDSSKSVFVPQSLINERRNSAARAPSSPSKMSAGCRRTRSFSLDINDEMNVVRGRHRITNSNIPTIRHFGLNYSSSVDISTTTVPEDTELNCTNSGMEGSYDTARAPEMPSGYHRKRSSSLPRILPPILDDDDDEQEMVVPEGHRRDQTSSLIVREMQKFICRQADDVTLVLPLPLPNRRESRLAGKPGVEKDGPRWRRGIRFDVRQIRVLLRSCAKIHACSFAIKCKTPRLFDEMCASLEASTEGNSQCPSKRYMNMSRDALAEAIKATPLITALTSESETNEILDSLYRQFEELHSPTSKPFSVIIHGDIRPENVTFVPGDIPGDEPKEAKLAGLYSAVIGSPLLDIYSVVFNCANPDARSLELEFLTTYFDAFVEVSNHLRMKVNEFTLNNLVSDFKKYELAGVLCAAAAADEPYSGSEKQTLANKMRNLSLDIPCDLPGIK